MDLMGFLRKCKDNPSLINGKVRAKLAFEIASGMHRLDPATFLTSSHSHERPP